MSSNAICRPDPRGPPKIKAEMLRLVRMGYVYLDTDLRWRRIGLRIDHDGSKRIVFVDAELLEPADCVISERENRVNGFIKTITGLESADDV